MATYRKVQKPALQYSIYRLINPICESIIYFGITTNEETRKRSHRRNAKPKAGKVPSGFNWKKWHYVENLKQNGIPIEFDVMARNLTEEQAIQIEGELIAHFRKDPFHQITNLADKGSSPSIEAREILSRKSKERWKDPEYRANFIAGMKKAGLTARLDRPKAQKGRRGKGKMKTLIAKLDGVVLGVFESIADFHRFIGHKSGHTSDAHKTGNLYNGLQLEIASEPPKGIQEDRERLLAHLEAWDTRKPVIAIARDGTEQSFPSISSAAVGLKIDRTSVVNALNGYRKNGKPKLCKGRIIKPGSK